MTELLAPAGSYEIAYKALTNGADAVYLATEKFGARAYAKNLSLEELKKIVDVAKILNKKVYVTVNTMIKENELTEIYDYLDTIYNIGVDAIISTDMAVINYALNNLVNMEVHISTQAGIKNLEDIRFFEALGVNRCVLARETNIKEIEKIKKNSKMPIEVFIHGALCVSYSGNCYMSSLLTLRSGNRGRCSQNCRFPYKLYEDEKLVSKEENLLSMKDLNGFNSVGKLKELNVDSLKVEGRMKDEDYVLTVIKEYRKKLDNNNYETNKLEKVFHREYTKGFLNNEDNGNIVYSKRSGNVGDYIGEIILDNNKYKVLLQKKLSYNDRIRITTKQKDYYFNVTELFDINNKKTTSILKSGYINLPEKIEGKNKLYIISYNENIKLDDIKKEPIDIIVNGKVNEKMSLVVYFKDETFFIESDNILEESKSKPLNEETFIKQFNKFGDYPLYIRDITFNVSNNVFMTISSLNELRRKTLNEMFNYNKEIKRKEITVNKQELEQEIICKCHTLDQVNAAKDLGIKTIYYKDNIISYTETNLNKNNSNLLVSNFGAIINNKNKELTIDTEFNVANSDSIAFYLNQHIKNITISKELSHQEIIELVTSFKKKYGFIPRLDLNIYGHNTLMTTKYCVLKHLNLCPRCKEHTYYLKDSKNKFILMHDNCITRILNNERTNLIDEIFNLKPYINRFRLEFTIEDYNETYDLIKKAIENFNGNKTNSFDSTIDTRAYYKRKIL